MAAEGWKAPVEGAATELGRALGSQGKPSRFQSVCPCLGHPGGSTNSRLFQGDATV